MGMETNWVCSGLFHSRVEMDGYVQVIPLSSAYVDLINFLFLEN